MLVVSAGRNRPFRRVVQGAAGKRQIRRQRRGVVRRIELQRWVAAAAKGTIDGPGVWDGYAAVAVCEAGVEALLSGERTEVKMGARP